MYEQLIEIVKQAGAMIREAHEAEIPVYDKEGIANFVTKYDKDVQSFLIRNFRQILPEANFLAEEDGIRQELGDGYCFIIDPIDGTTNFIFDYKFSCVSVGLAWKGRMQFGVVYNPYTEELYTAVKRAHIKMERGSTAVKKGLGKIWRHLAVPDIIQMIRARQTVFSDMQKYFISIRLRSEAVVPPRLTFAGSLREVMGSM